MTQQAIGVVGAGTMGQGIAQVLVASGFPVQLYDVADEQLGRAQAAIDKGLSKLVAKEKLGEAQKGEAMARLELTTSLEALRGWGDPFSGLDAPDLPKVASAAERQEKAAAEPPV